MSSLRDGHTHTQTERAGPKPNGQAPNRMCFLKQIYDLLTESYVLLNKFMIFYKVMCFTKQIYDLLTESYVLLSKFMISKSRDLVMSGPTVDWINEETHKGKYMEHT